MLLEMLWLVLAASVRVIDLGVFFTEIAMPEIMEANDFSSASLLSPLFFQFGSYKDSLQVAQRF